MKRFPPPQKNAASYEAPDEKQNAEIFNSKTFRTHEKFVRKCRQKFRIILLLKGTLLFSMSHVAGVDLLTNGG